MTLKLKRLSPAAVPPRYAHPGDAGMDLCACETVEIAPSSTAMVRTGWALALPPGTEGQIRPRSGLASRHAVTVLNAPGTVDEGFRGEVRVLLINHGLEVFRVAPGMRIAQLVVCPVLRMQTEEVGQLEDSHRGADGFGSTGA